MNTVDPAPLHPFEVRIVIGGDDWEYVRRTAQSIADYIAERDPDHCGLSSGGGGGCHSIDIVKRDVSIEQFHRELEEWRRRQVAGRPTEL